MNQPVVRIPIPIISVLEYHFWFGFIVFAGWQILATVLTHRWPTTTTFDMTITKWTRSNAFVFWPNTPIIERKPHTLQNAVDFIDLGVNATKFVATINTIENPI